MRGMVGFISFIFLVGTAGALELGNIGIGQAIIQSSIASAILYICTKERRQYYGQTR